VITSPRRAATVIGVLAGLLLCCTPAWAAEPAVDAAAPKLLLRHKAATVTTLDIQRFERDYARWLGYEVRERGRVSRELAASWGTPNATGSRYVLLSPDAAPDVFIRAVQARSRSNYRALTTWGWNSIEIVVEQTDAVHARFAASPFRTIGGPANLGGYPSIRAFQVVGPSQEVLYLTAETGDRANSPLPAPNGDIGRIFIMVLAGPDIDKMNEFYARAFNLEPGTVRQRPVGVVQNALGLGPEATIGLTTIRLAQHGNLIELDGYPSNTGARQVNTDELPPGIAIASFTVPDLDTIALDLIAPPRPQSGQLYGGQRMATAVGPAGELIELIEE